MIRIAAVTLLCGMPAFIAAAGEDCAAIAEAAARLACYDQAAQERGAAPAAPAPAPAPEGAAPAASGNAADRFGLPENEATQTIKARIDGELKEWRLGTRIRLDNGQVWKCLDDRAAYYPRLPDNAEVEITRTMFGYRMEIKPIKRRIYVKRES